MAKERDDFQFGVRKPRPKYPWDKWANGKVWEVVHGKGRDFSCTPGSLVVYLYHKAAQLDMNVRTSIQRGEGRQPDRVVFQFWKRDDEAQPEATEYRKLRRMKAGSNGHR